METSAEPSEYPWKFSSTVPANTGSADPTTVVRELDEPGVVSGIEAVSNQAAQQAVGVRVSDASGERWLPRNPTDSGGNEPDDYVGVDDNPITAQPEIRLDAGDQIEVAYINNDTESHYVRTLVYIREVDC